MPYNGSVHNLRGSPAPVGREDQSLRQIRKAALSTRVSEEFARRSPLLARPTPCQVQGLVMRRASATRSVSIDTPLKHVSAGNLDPFEMAPRLMYDDLSAYSRRGLLKDQDGSSLGNPLAMYERRLVVDSE